MVLPTSLFFFFFYVSQQLAFCHVLLRIMSRKKIVAFILMVLIALKVKDEWFIVTCAGSKFLNRNCSFIERIAVLQHLCIIDKSRLGSPEFLRVGFGVFFPYCHNFLYAHILR